MNDNASIILEEIRRQAERSPEELASQEFNELMKDYVIDRNVEYPDPEYLIEIGGVPTMPKGNLVALSAKWKNGKTFFCDILTAIFLGSDHFASCRSLMETGYVLFFDTEQAKSDTARIQKTIEAMIPEHRCDDFKVACLREASIDTDMDQSATVSRFDIITRAIVHEKPDLVIIDGIADLIYNYNDVIESQDVVNKLAAIANKHNCCIVVVMHQNKGQKDKNMKGHLGTMLFQKCSDVFNVEKCGSVFVASHAVSRHRNCEDICFKLDAQAVPMDAVADRQLQVEMEMQSQAAQLKEEMAIVFEESTAAMTRSEIAEVVMNKLGLKRSKAFYLVKNAIGLGILESKDGRHFFMPSA